MSPVLGLCEVSDPIEPVQLTARELWQLVALIDAHVKEMEEPEVLDPELQELRDLLGKIQVAQVKLGRRV